MKRPPTPPTWKSKTPRLKEVVLCLFVFIMCLFVIILHLFVVVWLTFQQEMLTITSGRRSWGGRVRFQGKTLSGRFPEDVFTVLYMKWLGRLRAWEFNEGHPQYFLYYLWPSWWLCVNTEVDRCCFPEWQPYKNIILTICKFWLVFAQSSLCLAHIYIYTVIGFIKHFPGPIYSTNIFHPCLVSAPLRISFLLCLCQRFSLCAYPPDRCTILIYLPLLSAIVLCMLTEWF